MNTTWLPALNDARLISSSPAGLWTDALAPEQWPQTAWMTPLPQWAHLLFEGPDAMTFLQGQLSSDVRALTPGAMQHSSYSTPKGRMLASMRVLCLHEGRYLLQLDADLADDILLRLKKFILRAKVSASRSDWQALGCFGSQLQDLHSGWIWPEQNEHAHVQTQGAWARLTEQRAMLIAAPEALLAFWQATNYALAPAQAWDWLDIQAGVGRVTPATAEQLVPQMANLDCLGGVSFSKGCYPGQEIVARTRYLGKVKKRMLPIYSDEALSLGAAVYSPELNGQATGQVVLAAPAPQGGFCGLAVVHLSSIEHGLHLHSPDGPTLTMGFLPYDVEKS